MNFETYKEKQADAYTKIKALEEEINNTAKANFNKMVQELFIKYPELNSFSWTQYTPYFNDGEPCEFGVHEVDEINGYRRWSSRDEQEGEGVNFYTNSRDDKYNTSTHKWEPNPEHNVYHGKVVEDVTDFIASFQDDTLQFLFGEGQITCRRGQDPDVDNDYSHD